MHSYDKIYHVKVRFQVIKESDDRKYLDFKHTKGVCDEWQYDGMGPHNPTSNFSC